jgi:hypothetical protein
MFARFILTVGLLTVGRWAQAEHMSITMAEDAREANTSLVTLPASDAGTLLFNDCAECNRNPLRLAPSSQYFLRGQEVTFSLFKAAYNKQADQLFTVYFKPDTHIVTRLKLNPVTARPAVTR